MEFVNETILNIMCLLFPLSIYIIVTVYFRNQDCNKKKLLLEVALYSSLYLLVKFGSKKILVYPMILFNIPLLVAYLRKNYRVVTIISTILVIYFFQNTDINLIYLIIEYLFYYLIHRYLIYRKKATDNNTINSFIIFKSFIMSTEMYMIFSPQSNFYNNIILIFSIMTILTSIAYLIVYFLNKGEDIMDLNNIICQLEKEKKLRESLFKITHEIKNPIAVCKGYLDMIDCEDTEKVSRYIPIITDEINRTLILMDDFLDYTKIQIDKEETDLYLLIEDTCDIVKPLFKKNNMKLIFDSSDDEIYMELDYNRLKQVLVNILKNSIEAKNAKKEKQYVNIDVTKRKDEVTIKIKDNGIGMDKKTLEKVDEMFYTTKEKGTGLGVALSKEIISQHGGSINYTSMKNKYTLVTITLPYQEKNY